MATEFLRCGHFWKGEAAVTKWAVFVSLHDVARFPVRKEKAPYQGAFSFYLHAWQEACRNEVALLFPYTTWQEKVLREHFWKEKRPQRTGAFVSIFDMAR
ncbi:unnamed protein product [Symbiodinium natans]|uniref:Uncharacterized protein n=1 Tax=Symbiodinium natans TaxID=878477 RepID=A0A812R8I0_9DINO|nr:unnamed protein product [Symbiodinium natans]